jgi:hypothetical protein
MDLSFKLIWWIYDEECRKHEEQIRVNKIRAEFENQWQMDTSIAGTLVQFPIELTEVLNLSSWIRNVIRTHIANGATIEDKDVVHLSMKPKPIALRYKKMRVYGNHYRVNEGGAKTTMATYDFGVVSIFQQPQATHESTALGSIVCGGTKGHNLARLWTYIPTSGAL